MITRGLKTSEFKVFVFTVAASLVAKGADWVNVHYAFGGVVLSSIAYIVSRGLAKYETDAANDSTNKS